MIAPPSRRRSSTVRSHPPEPTLVIAALFVLIAVGLAQAGDFLTFVRMIAVSGVEAELNPIVARGVSLLGMPVLAVAKVALVVLVASVFLIVARRHRRLAAGVATAGTGAGLIGAFSNVLAII